MVGGKGSKEKDSQETAQYATDVMAGNHESLIQNDAAKQDLAENKVGIDNKALSHLDANESANRTIPSSEDAYTCIEREKPEHFHGAKNCVVPTIEGRTFNQPPCPNAGKTEVNATDFDPCDQPGYVQKDRSSQVSEEVEPSEDLKNSVSKMDLSARNGTKFRRLVDELPNDRPVPERISTVDGGKRELKSETNVAKSLVNNKRKELSLTEEENKEFAKASTSKKVLPISQVNTGLLKLDLDGNPDFSANCPPKSFLLDASSAGVDESRTEEEQAAFMKELEAFHKERCLEFKLPMFYGEPLYCLKLWRVVIRLGGYEHVTSCKLWRQVGKSFKPPKTCTSVSWTFRCFYEKALLEYENHKMRNGELPFADASFSEPSGTANQGNQTSGSGRARRDAAARAMQGWHIQRLLGNGEIGYPIIKEKTSISTPKREKQPKSIVMQKRKNPSSADDVAKPPHMKMPKTHSDSMVTDIGAPADWVKVNVQKTNYCFEVYAFVPKLLREEAHVKCDQAGCLVITGQPKQVDNPWGDTLFKKVVSLPSRIDPH